MEPTAKKRKGGSRRVKGTAEPASEANSDKCDSCGDEFPKERLTKYWHRNVLQRMLFGAGDDLRMVFLCKKCLNKAKRINWIITLMGLFVFLVFPLLWAFMYD